MPPCRSRMWRTAAGFRLHPAGGAFKRSSGTGRSCGAWRFWTRQKINAGINLFVSIRTNQHSEAWATKFCRAAAQIPEVIEFYRMTGEVDYLLRVVVPNIGAYDDFYKRLIKTADLSDVSSSFAMETIKFTTALPLEYVQKSSAEAEPREPARRGRRRRSRSANRD
jgi:DNA-binding Lrp family transcriptional regulator